MRGSCWRFVLCVPVARPIRSPRNSINSAPGGFPGRFFAPTAVRVVRAIVQANGVTRRGFKTRDEALEDWRQSNMPPDVFGYLVKICASVSQEGRV
jgi:hypothetical protein